MMKSINDLKRHNDAIAPVIRHAIGRVSERSWYVLGPEVAAFEAAFAAYCGTMGCATVANGTDALELSLRAMGVSAGDEVITVANAGGYSTTAILAIGARPVFVDIQRDSLTINPSLVPNAFTPRTKAIVVTHLYGLAANMAHLLRNAKAAGIPILEDCAQAHGAVYDSRKVGSFGQAAAFSFYPTKNLGALGDGGAIVSNDPEFLTRVRQLRQYGWMRKYEVGLSGGRNSRLDELQAAILLDKLPLLDSWNQRRREIAARYKAQIKHPLVRCPAATGIGYVAHLYVVRTERRDSLRQHLTNASVPFDIHYPVPDHQQVAWRKLCGSAELPETERAAREVLTLPCFPEMTDDEVDTVCAAVNTWDS